MQYIRRNFCNLSINLTEHSDLRIEEPGVENSRTYSFRRKRTTNHNVSRMRQTAKNRWQISLDKVKFCYCCTAFCLSFENNLDLILNILTTYFGCLLNQVVIKSLTKEKFVSLCSKLCFIK